MYLQAGRSLLLPLHPREALMNRRVKLCRDAERDLYVVRDRVAALWNKANTTEENLAAYAARLEAVNEAITALEITVQELRDVVDIDGST
jgi:septal ring factor EnvC (AmiA/AmiB activator)